MAGDDIERTLGRIEQKIDDLGDRMDRHADSIYKEGGVEPRLRDVEGDVREIKTKNARKAGVIATAVSITIGALGWFFNFIFGKH